MKPQLVVALDVPARSEAIAVLRALPPEILWYKVGLELFSAEGPAIVRVLTKKNKKVFLDLKLHDIPNTVARAVGSATRHGVAMLTVHASGGRNMLKAAVEAAKEHGPSAPKLVAVTTLTSLGPADLRQIGVSRPLDSHTSALAEMAISEGIDGLVCSPNEALSFRKKFGDDPVIVTPGIRPAGADTGDQKRTATPEMAVRAGSNFLVVGRPILAAPDPRAAAREILRQIREAPPYANSRQRLR